MLLLGIAGTVLRHAETTTGTCERWKLCLHRWCRHDSAASRAGARSACRFESNPPVARPQDAARHSGGRRCMRAHGQVGPVTLLRRAGTGARALTGHLESCRVVQEASVCRLVLQAVSTLPCHVLGTVRSGVLRPSGRGSVGGVLGMALFAGKSRPQQADDHPDRNAEGQSQPHVVDQQPEDDPDQRSEGDAHRQVVVRGPAAAHGGSVATPRAATAACTTSGQLPHDQEATDPACPGAGASGCRGTDSSRRSTSRHWPGDRHARTDAPTCCHPPTRGSWVRRFILVGEVGGARRLLGWKLASAERTPEPVCRHQRLPEMVVSTAVAEEGGPGEGREPADAHCRCRLGCSAARCRSGCGGRTRGAVMRARTTAVTR